jgi:hypothetical protein
MATYTAAGDGGIEVPLRGILRGRDHRTGETAAAYLNVLRDFSPAFAALRLVSTTTRYIGANGSLGPAAGSFSES